MKQRLIAAATLVAAAAAMPALAQQGEQDTSMSFFLTSTGLGDGANLGGIAGADAHCAALADAVGHGNKTWRAYLSTSGSGGVNARDRIGQGPWFNVNGEMVAANLDDLHYSNMNFTKQRVLTETGEVHNGVGDSPNRHDILTGTNLDGTASGLDCNNWTHNDDGAQATVGHFDRVGGGPLASSWNASHPSRGCSQEQLQASGGDGFFYCFATGE